MATDDRSRAEYQRRVNKVLDHIRTHRSQELTLEELAAVASFSPFHFHRVFKSIVGENLREHIQRTRLEYAANQLATNPHVDILEVALDSGFNSASAFARAFKERFGVTASEWRRGCTTPPGASKPSEADRKLGEVERKPGKAAVDAEIHDAFNAGEHAGDKTKEDIMATDKSANVKVETLPSYRVAYMRYIGPYGNSGIADVWHRMARWGGPRDLWTPERICLGIPHDNPKVTDPAKCRYDAAVVIPAELDVGSEVNVMDVPGGKYAISPFVGKAWEVGAVYDRIFGDWLPRSGFQPDDRLIFELYKGEPYDQATGNFRCDICVPVRPL